MCSRLVVLDVWVLSVQCRVLDNIKITNINGALHGVWGVGIEKIFIEREGGGVALGGGVQAVAF